MKLSEWQLKETVNNIILNKGKDYYDNGNVDDLNIDFETSDIFKNNGDMNIETMVSSKFSSRKYNVYLEWDDKLKSLSGYCDCAFYKNNKGELGPCKHIIAVILKYINEYQDDINNINAAADTENFIKELQNISKGNSSYKREMNLGITFTKEGYSRTPEIDLSIGIEKNYVIRNMRKFLDAIKNKGVMEFGKSFTYDPSLYKFNETDEKIINMFLELRESEEDLTYNYYAHNIINGKQIKLKDMQICRFMKLAKDRKIDLVIDRKKYKDIKILEEELPVEFSLSKRKDNFELSELNGFPEPVDNSFRVFWLNDSLYVPPKEQMNFYKPIYLRLLGKDNKMIWKKEEGEKIIPKILPVLKSITNDINIESAVSDSFYEVPLTVKIYLDKDGNEVLASLKFCYDEIIIDPLKEYVLEDDKIIIRDTSKEISSIRVLESFGFTRGSGFYVMDNNKIILSFLTEGIKKLQELGEVYYSDSFKNIKVYNKSSVRGRITLNKEDFLEFSFDLDGINKEDLKDMFSALREKKKYFRLKNGDFVNLEDNTLMDLNNVIEYLNINDKDLLKDKIPLSKYNALYLDNKIKNMNLANIERSRDFTELTDNIKDIKNIDYNLPEHYKNVMRNYQVTGFKWLKTLAFYGFGGILADEMGLGKTLQAIAFLESEKEKGPSIVIAPTSLVYNWMSEIETFSKELKSIVIAGTKKERGELIEKSSQYDIIITSYPLIRRDIDKYKDKKFNFCILDEAQQIKNPSSLNASSVKELKARGYFALTGTPLENSLSELWSIFDFIMPGYLLSYNKFIKIYETPIIKDEDKNALSELNKHIRPFILRRYKKDVVKELPPKIEKKILVDMTKEQKNLYAYYLKNARREVSEEIKGKGFNKSRIRIVALLTRLRQICCDPTVFVEGYTGDNGKMLALDDLLDGIVNEGHRLLLFSQFTSVLKNIKGRLDKNMISNMYLDGSTKSENRLKLVDEFNKGDTSVFLISLKAGGTGLNLTGADMVLHFDPWWNPAIEEQATDRAHRIGQVKTVEVIKLIAKGTIEEKIYKLQDKKKEIIKSVIDGNLDSSNIIGRLSQEEIENLFT